jgi:hypothetical protein
MRPARFPVLSLASLALLCSCVLSQDVSLGDLARRQRQQKQQTAKNDPAAAAKSSKVFTDSDLPSSPSDPSLPTTSQGATTTASNTAANPASIFAQSAESWKNQITAQKSYVASLQAQVSQLSESIHFAGGSCVYNCVQWNERQKQKMDQVERLKSQLDEGSRKLESMQDAARRQGFGSSVYEP